MDSDSSNYNLARIEYILAGIMYGTIGWILHYVNLPSETVVFLRGIIGALFVLVYLKVLKRKLDLSQIRSNLLYLFLSGASLGLNWVFLFAAYRHTSVAIGTLCNYTGPIIVILLAPFLYKEKLHKITILCVLAAAVGLVLISGVLEGEFHGNNMLGIIFGLLSALFFVFLVIFNKKIESVDSYNKTVPQLLSSALMVLPVALIMNRSGIEKPDIRSVVLVLVLGVVHTGVAYIFYFRAINTLSVKSFSMLGYIEPVVAIFVSAIFLKEPLRASGIIGAVLILGSAFTIEYFESKKG